MKFEKNGFRVELPGNPRFYTPREWRKIQKAQSLPASIGQEGWTEAEVEEKAKKAEAEAEVEEKAKKAEAEAEVDEKAKKKRGIPRWVIIVLVLVWVGSLWGAWSFGRRGDATVADPILTEEEQWWINAIKDSPNITYGDTEYYSYNGVDYSVVLLSPINWDDGWTGEVTPEEVNRHKKALK